MRKLGVPSGDNPAGTALEALLATSVASQSWPKAIAERRTSANPAARDLVVFIITKSVIYKQKARDIRSASPESTVGA
jgi:hypothetical protein